MHHGPRTTTLPISTSVGQLVNQELAIVVRQNMFHEICPPDQVAAAQHLVS
jgi:hypothetical protein